MIPAYRRCGRQTSQDCRQLSIHTAGFDILRDEGQAYAEALERAGVKVKHFCHQHMIHHFYAMAGAIPTRAPLEAIGADIKAALNPAALSAAS